ncbi:hypothetical protein [Geopsychrobacter electrodiphilus]|uniref:hypothetical protein n=1 Tax=Geopsychrobacter electrodiphilus TaxID=225196 RepID=UPI0003718D7C|nr:hypothetical protein [Geopsychrobacter electrodiphilus]
MILENLANDEDAHAMQLRFALRFPAGTALVDKRFDLAPVNELLSRVKLLLELATQQQLDTRQALEMGVELEQEFCTTHIGSSMEFRDENLKKMFAALAEDDKTHKQKRVDAKTRLSLAALNTRTDNGPP